MMIDGMSFTCGKFTFRGSYVLSKVIATFLLGGSYVGSTYIFRSSNIKDELLDMLDEIEALEPKRITPDDPEWEEKVCN